MIFDLHIIVHNNIVHDPTPCEALQSSSNTRHGVFVRDRSRMRPVEYLNFTEQHNRHARPFPVPRFSRQGISKVLQYHAIEYWSGPDAQRWRQVSFHACILHALPLGAKDTVSPVGVSETNPNINSADRRFRYPCCVGVRSSPQPCLLYLVLMAHPCITSLCHGILRFVQKSLSVLVLGLPVLPYGLPFLVYPWHHYKLPLSHY